jgi:hypothetical protein
MQGNDRDQRRARGAAERAGGDVGRADGMQTPGGMPAPRTDLADTGHGGGRTDPQRRNAGDAGDAGDAGNSRRPTGDETVGDPSAASREGGLEAGAGTGGLGLGDTRTEGLDELDPPEDRGRFDPDTDEGNRGLFGGRAGGTGP